jgi:AmpD protein
VKIDGGWLDAARRRPSPNCDARPDPQDIDLLVIHNISLPPRVFGGPWIDDLFLNRLDPHAHPCFAEIADLHVSAHILIRRSGEIVQYVPFHHRAWHAGQSCFQGRERCNDFSIGIELEGADDLPFTDCQYDQLTSATRAVMSAYPRITADRITGHSHIAPGRKTDPGQAFDWKRFQGLLETCGR